MIINIEDLEKVNPAAVEVLQKKFVETMRPDPDNSLISIEIDNKTFDVLGRGEIMAIQGKSGTSKTTCLEMIIGACLAGQVGKFRTKNIKNILHVDTEQSYNQWVESNFRILKYSRLEKSPEGYVSVHLKRYPTDQRPLIVDDIIMNADEIDLVVIDGIADIIFNENDIEGTKRLIDDIQKWIDTKNAGFITILHEGKSKDNNTMKGHIGSYLNQKATTTVAINKEWDSNVLEMKPMKTRGKYWKAQNFVINDMKMIDTGDVFVKSDFIAGAREKKQEVKSSILSEVFEEVLPQEKEEVKIENIIKF